MQEKKQIALLFRSRVRRRRARMTAVRLARVRVLGVYLAPALHPLVRQRRARLVAQLGLGVGVQQIVVEHDGFGFRDFRRGVRPVRVDVAAVVAVRDEPAHVSRPGVGASRADRVRHAVIRSRRRHVALEPWVVFFRVRAGIPHRRVVVGDSRDAVLEPAVVLLAMVRGVSPRRVSLGVTRAEAAALPTAEADVEEAIAGFIPPAVHEPIQREGPGHPENDHRDPASPARRPLQATGVPLHFARTLGSTRRAAV